MKKWALIGILALTSLFCSVGGPSVATPDVNSIVAGTLTALAANTTAILPALTATPTLSTTPMSSFPDMGTISGRLSYPSSGIPALRIVAFPIDGSAPSYTDTPSGQSDYTFDLPVGTYHVVAYSLGTGGFPSGLAGGYTQAVPCGLTASCTDHSLVDVAVAAGTTTPDVDPGDWYAPDGTFPPMPVP